MYAYFKRLDYFSTECVYAPFAARGFARDFVKDLEVGGERGWGGGGGPTDCLPQARCHGGTQHTHPTTTPTTLATLPSHRPPAPQPSWTSSSQQRSSGLPWWRPHTPPSLPAQPLQ